MADFNSSRSSGGISLTTLGAGIYAYVTIPQLTGLKGVFAAAMTGMGTSLVAGLYALGGGLIGAGLGGTIGAVAGRPKEGAVVGAILFGLSGAVYGIPQGYGHAVDIVLNGVPKVSISESHAEPSKSEPFRKAAISVAPKQSALSRVSGP